MSARVPLMVATALWVAVVLAVAAVGLLTDVHPLELFSEEVGLRGGHWYQGSLSFLAFGLWSVAAVLLLARNGTALRALGVFTALVAVDDAFGLHEGALARITGVPDLTARVLFVAAALLLAARHGRALLAHPHAPVLVAAVAALGLSLAVDVTGAQVPEELLELLGADYWLAFAALCAVRAIDEGRAE